MSTTPSLFVTLDLKPTSLRAIALARDTSDNAQTLKDYAGHPDEYLAGWRVFTAAAGAERHADEPTSSTLVVMPLVVEFNPDLGY